MKNWANITEIIHMVNSLQWVGTWHLYKQVSLARWSSYHFITAAWPTGSIRWHDYGVDEKINYSEVGARDYGSSAHDKCWCVQHVCCF